VDGAWGLAISLSLALPCHDHSLVTRAATISRPWPSAVDDVFLDMHGIGAGARWKEALAKANEPAKPSSSAHDGSAAKMAVACGCRQMFRCAQSDLRPAVALPGQ
jgi:hypothetical protein